MFYFILAWRGLKFIEIKCFFLPTSNKSAIQNNPLMQLLLIFHKAINKDILKVKKFQIHELSRFSAITKSMTRVEEAREG